MAHHKALSIKDAPAGLFRAVVRPLQAFVQLEASSGILLLASAVAALVWANAHPSSYHATFDYPLALGAGKSAVTFTLAQFVNDGLMTIFFFVVGMEIKRELVVGELNSVSAAVLPAIAALGGVLVPAAIFSAFNAGGAGRGGWGIPMATDIAFCVGILTLLKDHVPRPLVVFVTALAIFDDIACILLIALFYGHGLSVPWLIGAGALTLVLLAMNRAYVTNGLAYALLGAGLWYAVHHGGIHATISGVVLGLMIPARTQRAPRKVLQELCAHVTGLAERAPDENLDGAEILGIENELEDLQAPVDRFIHTLHGFVAFFVMPLFALANSGVELAGSGISGLTAPVALGAALGLFAGKQFGIFGAAALAIKFGLSPMPGNASWVKLYGVSVVAGIGFTVALFIAALAFHSSRELLDQAKLGVLSGSVAAGLLGFAVLRLSSGGKRQT
jgi:NhaA family Na+:H+ antiporter